MTDTSHSGPQSPRKSVLVCGGCGHEAPLDGDWAVTEFELGGGHHRMYQCPACWYTLVVQPVFERGDLAVPA
jgi:hypothetical protein